MKPAGHYFSFNIPDQVQRTGSIFSGILFLTAVAIAAIEVIKLQNSTCTKKLNKRHTELGQSPGEARSPRSHKTPCLKKVSSTDLGAPS